MAFSWFACALVSLVPRHSKNRKAPGDEASALIHLAVHSELLQLITA